MFIKGGCERKELIYIDGKMNSIQIPVFSCSTDACSHIVLGGNQNSEGLTSSTHSKPCILALFVCDRVLWVALPYPELAPYTRLAPDSQRSVCLCLRSDGIEVVHAYVPFRPLHSRAEK